MDLPEATARAITGRIEGLITEALDAIDPGAMAALQAAVDAHLDRAGRGPVTLDPAALRAAVWLALQGIARSRARAAAAETEARLAPQSSGTTVRAALGASAGLSSHTALERRLGIITPEDRRAYRSEVEAARRSGRS